MTSSKILLFSSRLCSTCIVAKKRLKNEEFKNLDVEILDSSEDYELFLEHQVKSVPTFIKLVDNKEVKRKVGFKGLDDIRRLQ